MMYFEMYRESRICLTRGSCRQTLDCYCVSCELLSASMADTLIFVNILVSGIFHGLFAQRLAVNKPCLQIIRRLRWKQTTTRSLRNNNPMFDGKNLLSNKYDSPSRRPSLGIPPPGVDYQFEMVNLDFLLLPLDDSQT